MEEVLESDPGPLFVPLRGTPENQRESPAETRRHRDPNRSLSAPQRLSGRFCCVRSACFLLRTRMVTYNVQGSPAGAGSKIRNPIHKVLSTFRNCGLSALLMGGQACVFCGAAEFSRDTDFPLL